MMISCQKATELLSKQMDASLSSWENIQVYAHLFFCGGCKVIRTQNLILQKIVQKLARDSMDFELHTEIRLPGLSPEAKERILKAIRSNSS